MVMELVEAMAVGRVAKVAKVANLCKSLRSDQTDFAWNGRCPSANTSSVRVREST